MILNKEKAMQSYGLDLETYTGLLADAIQQAVDFNQKLASFIASMNHEEIVKGAHFIKGSSAMLGMEEVSKIALDLEMAGKQKESAAPLQSKMAALQGAIDDVKKEASNLK